jgi:chromosome segregation ATPase
MTADMRGFVYRLRAVHQRARHRLDTATAEAAARRDSVAALKARAEDIERAIRQREHRMALPGDGRLDPVTWATHLQHLLAWRQRAADLQLEIEVEEARLTEALRAVMDRQTDLETLERLRADQQRSFAQRQLQLAQIQADQDWLARQSWMTAWLQRGIGASPAAQTEGRA